MPAQMLLMGPQPRQRSCLSCEAAKRKLVRSRVLQVKFQGTMSLVHSKPIGRSCAPTGSKCWSFSKSRRMRISSRLSLLSSIYGGVLPAGRNCIQCDLTISCLPRDLVTGCWKKNRRRRWELIELEHPSRHAPSLGVRFQLRVFVSK